MSNNSPILAAGAVTMSFAQLLKPITEAQLLEGQRTRSSKSLDERLQKLKEEAEADGFAAGFEDGKKAGFAAGRAEALSTLEQERLRLENEIVVQHTAELQALMNQIQADAERWARAGEAGLTDLASAVVRNILHAELKVDRGSVLTIVRDICHKFVQAKRVTLRVNPQDIPYLEANQSDWAKVFDQVESIEVVGDPGIDGGAILESDLGRVDASIETQVIAFDTAVKSIPEAA